MVDPGFQELVPETGFWPHLDTVHSVLLSTAKMTKWRFCALNFTCTASRFWLQDLECPSLPCSLKKGTNFKNKKQSIYPSKSETALSLYETLPSSSSLSFHQWVSETFPPSASCTAAEITLKCTDLVYVMSIKLSGSWQLGIICLYVAGPAGTKWTFADLKQFFLLLPYLAYFH